MRTALRTALVGACVVASVITSAPAATAATAAIENESFGITPFPERTDGTDRSSFSIPLETGETFEDAVRLYNLTDEPVRLALYAADAQTTRDDTISVGRREEHPTGVGRWIDLALKTVELGPRDAKTVTFRVKVGSSDPEPELGAVVAENTDGGLASNAVQRLHVLVRTVPPNTQTSSKRVRMFLVQSPWIAIALVGLVVAGALVWRGARRSRRRARDGVVEPGALDVTDATGAPHPRRPVIGRLGSADPPPQKTSFFDRIRGTGAGRRHDERPLLDDALLVEVNDAPDEAVDDDAAAPTDRDAPAVRPRVTDGSSAAPTRRTPARKSKPASRPKAKGTASAKRSASSGKKASTAAKRSSGTAKRPASKAKPKPRAKSKARAKPKAQPDKNFIPLKDL